MAIGNETFNHELYRLLKVRGYHPTPLNSQNQRVKASQEADVIEFDFVKEGENYGKVWINIDDASNVCIYFDDEQADSPSNATPGTDYDDTWTGLLKHIKQWAQRRQLSFELANKDRLGDDMRQRDYYKMKEKLGEGYHSMGKKASYNDAVPNVKIVLQHNRALEEGEQRYRNVDRIFLENADGERFLAPTTKPGIARVYARHIAEGGVPNDERWNHIKTVCEEYNKMAGFVRATRNKEFNESAHLLVQEGANHYSNLRETLNKLAGHRGYHAYFESYSPPLMEEEDDSSINELFVQETMDPRIESVMPILSRLHKKVSETAVLEVDSLAEWADSVINEKLEDDKKDPKKPVKKKEPKQDDDSDSEENVIGAGPLAKIKSRAEKKISGKVAKFLGVQESDVIKFPKGWVGASDEGEDDDDLSWIPSEEELEREEEMRNRKPKAANDVNEMDKSSNDYNGWGHSKHEVSTGPDKTAKMMAAKDAVKIARKALDKAFKGDVEENFIGMAPQAVAEEEVEEGYYSVRSNQLKQELENNGWERIPAKEVPDNAKYGYRKNGVGSFYKVIDEPYHSFDVSFVKPRRVNALIALDDLLKLIKGSSVAEEVEEGLDANQKRVGQLGPTEKVKNNNIGKLVGANEAMNYEDEGMDEGILDTIKSRVKSFIGKPAPQPGDPNFHGTSSPEKTKLTVKKMDTAALSNMIKKIEASGDAQQNPHYQAAKAELAGRGQQNPSGLNDYIKKIAADLNAADPKTKISLVKELVGIMADRKGHPEWDNVIGSVKGILKRAGVNPNVAAAASAKLQAGQTFESAMQEAINLLLESTGLTMKILNESEDLLDIRRLAGL